MRTALRSLAALTLFLLISVPAEAQYFGKNKVQWENFHFKTLRTEHFDIYYYEQEADVVQDVGRMAERWYARLSKVFDHSFARKPIVLYANSADFHQTTTTGGFIGEGTGGFTDAFMNRVVLPLTGDMSENDHVLGHEIVHVFQYDIAASARQDRRRFNLEMMPLWLVEGMAEYFSKGRVDPLTAMWIRDASIHDRMPDLRKLERDPRYFPYRYGQALMAYIGARFGDEMVVRYFIAAGMVGVQEGFDRAIGISATQLFQDWRASASELYAPILAARPADLGTPLLGSKTTRGDLNIAPALSPDGRYIAFLSTRSLFSIDLFLADAKTGQIIRRLVSSDRDSHFESLRFIDSAGGWSPDSKRIAFITFSRGDNFLSIVDVESRKTEHIRVPGLEAMNNPAWSPDGRTIAVSGQTTGVSDLFLYNLDTKEVRRLTSDAYADLQPAWSPDGRTLAWVTDRGPGTNLEQLAFTDMRIATMDVASGAVTVLPLFDGAKHISPQWSPDGRSIYFVADPEGIDDVFRYSLVDKSTAQITHVQTGVSGITELAPALTVASRSGDIAFTLFEDDKYNIYTLPPTASGPPVNVVARSAEPRAGVLPPLRSTGSEITDYLSRPAEGLPAANTFEQRPYDPKLRLAYLGPPTIGAGVGEAGFAVGGSIGAYFSDVLGQHNVGFTFAGGASSGSSIGDQLAGEVFYLNQQNRFNWGVDVQHVPYINVQSGYGTTVIDINGQPTPVDVYQELRETQRVSEVSGISQYPFSVTRRIEGSAGFERYSYKAELETLYGFNGEVVDRTIERLPGDYAFNLLKASVAFVGDSSTYGFVSPVAGTRYRYEIEQLTGDLKFNTLTADYRKYWFARPVTFAVRGLHYGRYGTDAESDQLSLLNVGSYSLVRGYEPGSIDASECGSSLGNGGACPVFDRLVGSRIAVGGFEVRAPLFGTREFGLINASFLPTEIMAFFDAGAAWLDDEEVTWKWATDTDERVPVFSAGIGLRILLSYIPIEVYAAKPFQRPDEGIVYGFNIISGW